MSKFKFVSSVSFLLRYFVESNFKNKGKIAIDATVGNGNDALFLSNYFEEVIGLDIQEKAIEASKELLLSENVKNVRLHLLSNEFIDSLNVKPDLIVYNLGYLPGADKAISTSCESTIKSLQKSIELIEEGYIVISLYPGHREGFIEKEHVMNFVKSLPTKNFGVLHMDFINRKNSPPTTIIIEKRK